MSTKHASNKQQKSTTIWFIGAAIVLVVGLSAIVAIAVGGNDSGAAPADVSQTQPIRVDGTPLPELTDSGADPAVGMKAPVLTGLSFDGTPESTQGSRPRLLVMLAHWCSHCQREVPQLVAWEANGGVPEGLDVIGISTGVDENAPNYPPSTWLEREQFPWPVIADDNAGSAAGAMGLPGFPYFVLVDSDGIVEFRASGEIDPADLTAQIEAALVG